MQNYCKMNPVPIKMQKRNTHYLQETLMKRIANFLFEAGMLKRTPRTGFQFLGSGAESVA